MRSFCKPTDPAAKRTYDICRTVLISTLIEHSSPFSFRWTYLRHRSTGPYAASRLLSNHGT